jgi:hypothetical protein
MVTGKEHRETGLAAPQNLRPSAFVCGSLLHGYGLGDRPCESIKKTLPITRFYSVLLGFTPFWSVLPGWPEAIGPSMRELQAIGDAISLA